jgi:hypothetical protein
MLYERNRIGEFLVTNDSQRSFREKVVSSVATLAVGTILVAAAAGAQSVVSAARAGNTGNGVLSAVTADAGAAPGVYTLTCLEPSANGGTFDVEDPAGVSVGVAKVGVIFNGPINVTVNDGATDFAAGDAFTVTVSYAEGNGVLVGASAAGLLAGTEEIVGILWERVAAAGANSTVRRNVVVADAEVTSQAGRVRFPAGADADETAAIRKAAIEGLAALGIVVVG